MDADGSEVCLTKPKPMQKIIDVHHHILPERYVREVGAVKIGAQGSSGRIPEWSVEDALRRMDAYGVGTAITSITSPGLDLDDRSARSALARWCNEFAAGLAAKHTGRFGMFATLPLPDVDATLREIDFTYSDCRADGVCMLSNHDGMYADDPRLRPVFAELDRRAAVVFVHPTLVAGMKLVGGLSASTLEFTFDTTRAVAAVIFGGVLRDFPHIRFIFSHAGGAMPYVSDRIELLTRNNPRLQEFIPQGIGAELRKLYFDTALSAHRAPVVAMLANMTADNILFGSDYPFGPRNQIEDAVARLAGLGLPAADREKIQSGNASALFPRFAAA